jgi:hypothetical protein
MTLKKGRTRNGFAFLVEAFQNAYGPHAKAIMGDMPNYTDIQPTLQISEVKI